MKKLLLTIILLSCSAAFGQQTNGQITAANSTCTAGVCVSAALSNNAGASAIVLSGTFSGTLQFEGSAASNTNFSALLCTPTAGGTSVSSATAGGTWTCNVAGLTDVRVRGSIYSSGTVVVTINNSPASASSRTALVSGGAGSFTTLTASGLSTLSATSIVKVIRDCRQDGLVADGVTDDSTALNNCLANAYANGQAVQLPSGKIKVNTSINDTNKPGLNIMGVGQHQDYGTDVLTQNYGTTQTEIMCNTGNICWDATGSGRQTMSNFHLRIVNSYSNPSTVGALFGRDNAVSNGSSSGSGTYCFSEMNYLWKFGVYADTRPAATAVGSVGIYNVGAEQMVIEAGDYIADMPVFMSATNDLGLTSAYQTILTGCAASMAAVHVQGGTRFQPWTKAAFDLRGPVDFDFSADVELLNGTIGTNHNPCYVFNGPIASNVFLRGQCEGFDSALTINSTSADHIVAEMAMVNPVAGMVAITAGVPVTNSRFYIMQRNGTPQPFINAATGATTIKGSEIFMGGLSGAGAGASAVTLTESSIYAPGLTDTNVNTFNAASAYQVFDDTGNSFFGALSTNGQLISTLATGTAPLVIASTTNVANLNASSLSGATFATPGAIGGTTPSTGKFTTVQSTQATGTAPLTIASTTPVANLSINGGGTVDGDVIGGVTPAAGSFTTLKGTTFNSTTNCAVNSASPAACASAPTGVIVVPTLTTTYTVNTTAVAANSRIFLQPTSDNTGIPSAPTCATLAVTSVNMISSRVAATSFTFSTPSTTGTTCFYFWILN